MPTKGSLILEGGSESHPQEISGIKLYNEEGKYSDGIQAGGASNGATYIELNQMQLGESTASGNTNNYETGTLKGSLILEGGSESHPQEISGIKLYNEEGKYSDGIQAGGASNGATYIELNQMQLGESTASGNTNNYETGINIKGGANLSATGSNLNATVNGIEVGTGESAGVITVGEGTTLIGETGAGISNVGTIEKIKDEGTIAGGDYGVDNAGNIGNIVGGTPTEAEGVIEGVHVGVNNTNSIGNIEYLSMIKGTYLGGGTGFSSFGVYNRGGTIGDIIGSASTKTEGTIEGAFAGIFNSGKIENIEYLSMIKGTYEEGDYPSYGIYNVATIGDIVGGTNLKKAGSIEGFVSGIYNHGGGAIGTVEYFSTIEGTGSASLFLVSGTSMGIENNSTDNIGEIRVNGSIGIENRGKIGSSEVEYGIKNEGIIADIVMFGKMSFSPISRICYRKHLSSFYS